MQRSNATDIDTMTPDQLRDALSRATGWEPQPDGTWKHRDSDSTISGVPMPPLDAPIALGLVAGMMPRGWHLMIDNVSHGDFKAGAWRWNQSPKDVLVGDGRDETTARARLVLKILACSNPTSSPARPS